MAHDEASFRFHIVTVRLLANNSIEYATILRQAYRRLFVSGKRCSYGTLQFGVFALVVKEEIVFVHKHFPALSAPVVAFFQPLLELVLLLSRVHRTNFQIEARILNLQWARVGENILVVLDNGGNVLHHYFSDTLLTTFSINRWTSIEPSLEQRLRLERDYE